MTSWNMYRKGVVIGIIVVIMLSGIGYTAVSAASDNVLIGAWVNRAGVFIFRNDGTCFYLHDGHTFEGAYSFEGNRLTVSELFETPTFNIEIKEEYGKSVLTFHVNGGITFTKEL